MPIANTYSDICEERNCDQCYGLRVGRSRTYLALRDMHVAFGVSFALLSCALIARRGVHSFKAQPDRFLSRRSLSTFSSPYLSPRLP